MRSGQVRRRAERRLGQEGARVRDRAGGGRRRRKGEGGKKKREKRKEKKEEGKREKEKEMEKKKRKREREGEKVREIAGADRGERSRVATGRRARDALPARKKREGSVGGKRNDGHDEWN